MSYNRNMHMFWPFLPAGQKREQVSIVNFWGPPYRFIFAVLSDFKHVVPEAWTMYAREFLTTDQKREQFSIIIIWGPWTTFLAVLSDFKHVVPEAWTMCDREFLTTGQKREQCTIVFFWRPWTFLFEVLRYPIAPRIPPGRGCKDV